MTPPQDAHERLQRLGKYEIHKRLGAGGMGAVFLAVDQDLKRTVALKVLPKDRAENPILVRRFKSEAQAVAQLRHDNIVSIYEAGEIEGFPYIALEFVDGLDLLTLIQKRGVLSPKRSLNIVRQVVEALEHAFGKGIIHRDIKPANLLIKPDGIVKLTDLGLARSVDDTLDTSITRAGTTVGTVDYISPEQACDSKAADIRSDIYSLGCTWYHMLVGTPPFPDGDLRNKLQGHLNQPPPDPSALNANVPEAYIAVMHRMMAKKPEDRYQSPAELLKDLDKVVNASTTSDHLLQSLIDEGELPDRKRQKVAKDTPPSKQSVKPSSKTDAKPAAKGRAPERSEPQASEALPSRETTSRQYKQKPTQKPTKTRNVPVSEVAEDDSPDHKPSGGSAADEPLSRKMPVKGRSGEGKPKRFNVDLDVARIGLIGMIVVGMLGGLWFAMSRWSDSSGNAGKVVERPDVRTDYDGEPVDPEKSGRPADDSAVPAARENRVIALLATEQQQARRDGPAFPGSEDLTATSAAAREFVPDWVYLLREEVADRRGAVIVQSPPAAGTRPSLATALSEGGGQSRVIEVRGAGPYPLPPRILNNITRLTIRAAEGSRPLVVIAASESPTDRAHLSLQQGTLTLEGLDILVHGAPAESNRSLFGMRFGTIVLRDCTVTSAETSGPVTICHVIGSPDGASPARVLLERTVIRGGAVTAVRAQGGYLDVVSGGSLLASKTGPLFQIDVDATSQTPVIETTAVIQTDEAPATEDTEADPSDNAPLPTPPSMVRLLGSILVSGGEGIRLQHQASSSIGRCVIQMRRSICAAAEGERPVLLSLSPWPLRASTLSGESRVPGLGWRQEFSQLADWDSLVRGESGTGTTLVKTRGEWQAFWSVPPEAGSLVELSRLPAESPMRANDDLRSQLSERVSAELRQGREIGVAAPLPVTPDEAINRYLLVEGRPRLPEDYRQLPPPTLTLKFDLRTDRDRIATALESTQTPDGALVQLTGFGLRELPPLRIQGKSLRIEFVQEGGDAPLTIRPAAAKGDTPEALIVVENGRVDLINARMQVPSSPGRGVPTRLLLVRNGDFSLRRCTLNGSLRNDAPQEPFIAWVGTSAGPSFGFISDTFLVGHTTLVSAEIDSRLLEIQNSVLASKGNVLTLTSAPPSDGSASGGWAMLEGCTVLAGTSAVQVTGELFAQAGAGPHLMANDCIWGVAPGVSAEQVCLLQHPKGMTNRNLINWWEQRNGFLPTLVRYRRVAGEPSGNPQNYEQDWRGFWPSGHVERPILGNAGVVFGTVLSSLDNLQPTALTLTPGCAAVHAAQDGGPLGARTTTVGAIVESTTGSRPSPNAPPQAPRPPPTKTPPAKKGPDL